MKNIAVVFPGQGSQVPGIAKNVINNSIILEKNHRDFIERVECITDVKVNDYLVNGIDEKDPLIYQISVITYEIILYLELQSRLRDTKIDVNVLAGHSLGSYAAIYLGGLLTLEDTLNIIKERQLCVLQNNKRTLTGMLAITGLTTGDVLNIFKATKTKNIFPSNINSYNQIVFSGDISSLKEFSKELDGIAYTTLLDVYAGFHSPCMESSNNLFKKYVQSYNFEKIDTYKATPSVINYESGRMYTNQVDVIDSLFDQLVSPVNWVKVVRSIAKLKPQIILEVGARKILTKFNNNILENQENNDIKSTFIKKIDDIEGVLNRV